MVSHTCHVHKKHYYVIFIFYRVQYTKYCEIAPIESIEVAKEAFYCHLTKYSTYVCIECTIVPIFN